MIEIIKVFIYDIDLQPRKYIASRLLDREGIKVVECPSAKSFNIHMSDKKFKNTPILIISKKYIDGFLDKASLDKTFVIIFNDYKDDMDDIEKQCFKIVESNNFKKTYDMLILGSSTGGFPVVSKIINQLCPKHSSIIVCQHIDKRSSEQLKQAIENKSCKKIKLIDRSHTVNKGEIMLLIGGSDYKMMYRYDKIKIARDITDSLYHPSINSILSNIDSITNFKIGVIILSGLGNDGAESIQNIKSDNIDIIVQNLKEATSPSMPMSAIQSKKVNMIFSSDQIIKYLKDRIL